ncbi:MAG: hypothetical protein WCI01_11745, partial [Chlorobiaceae bacterium]
MSFQDKRFTVGVGGTKNYNDNWERIFGKGTKTQPTNKGRCKDGAVCTNKKQCACKKVARVG